MTANGLRTGVAAADALLGGMPTHRRRHSPRRSGVVSLDDLALTGAAAKLTGNAQFDPASHGVNATLSVDIPRLEALRPTLGIEIAGAVSARSRRKGRSTGCSLQTEIDGE